RAIPPVLVRVGVDPDPVDVTDAEQARWLRACLPPDRPERRARLDAEMALTATAPAPLLGGGYGGGTPSRCCPPPWRRYRRTPCRSSPRPGRCRRSRWKPGCAFCSASTR